MSTPTTITMSPEDISRFCEKAEASYEPVPEELRQLSPGSLELELLNRELAKMPDRSHLRRPAK